MKIDMERVVSAFLEEDDDKGFCLECGVKAHSVEPDTRDHKCEDCGANKVFGAEEILLMREYK